MRKRKGSVKWFNQKKKFGFILSKDNAEVFFHINDCKNFTPKENMTVEFETGLDRMSRKKAINIVGVGVCYGNKIR